MIVFNLACEHDHLFEGWFASADDMASQKARGLLSCPMCSSTQVEKQLSAPRLNLLPSVPDHAPAKATGQSSSGQTPHAMMAPQQAEMLAMLRKMVESTEDVGSKFPEEARRIHYKETEARSIRGVASQKEAAALAEEGIAVTQLPFPVVDKSELN
jgi:hypothetical protein